MDEKLLNLLSLAIDKKPTEFYEQVDEILKERALDTINKARVVVASELYGDEITESDEEEDFDLDDLDLDDIDLDDLEEDLEGEIDPDEEEFNFEDDEEEDEND